MIQFSDDVDAAFFKYGAYVLAGRTSPNCGRSWTIGFIALSKAHRPCLQELVAAVTNNLWIGSRDPIEDIC